MSTPGDVLRKIASFLSGLADELDYSVQSAVATPPPAVDVPVSDVVEPPSEPEPAPAPAPAPAPTFDVGTPSATLPQTPPG